MAPAVGIARDVTIPGRGSVIGRLTIPGRPEHVREARAFVARTLGEGCPAADTAILLTSEIVANAVVHSRSRQAGGSIRLMLADFAGGLRVEVVDDGSDLSIPVVRDDTYAPDGHGLFLVQSLSGQWGYFRDKRTTTVWFWLGCTEHHGRERGATSAPACEGPQAAG